ncbi:hypothetical protein RI845_18645 [Thalassotalea nanhaiensis]|uniref:Uncharacterized protein n=1 Tax=Thalassotalea nanhaiensis TaxID=3065648 RepID=A0ABY9TI78_9GAMM|nr:hypothetical protein RI845_18645 [Colwelliaceae bacterium SQ345]
MDEAMQIVRDDIRFVKQDEAMQLYRGNLFQAKKNQRQGRWLEAYGEARKQKLLQQEFR